MYRVGRFAMLTFTLYFSAALLAAPPQKTTTKKTAVDPVDARLQALKKDVAAEIDGMTTFTQQMIDSVYSFGELGFQEYETSKYIVAALRQHGFTVKEGVSGMPTAWVATEGTRGRGRLLLWVGANAEAGRRRP